MTDLPPAAPPEPAFKVGDRVELQLEHSVFALGEFPAGALGAVTWINSAPCPTQPVGHVRLDEPFPNLDAWENELQVWSEQDGEITWASFKRVPA